MEAGRRHVLLVAKCKCRGSPKLRSEPKSRYAARNQRDLHATVTGRLRRLGVEWKLRHGKHSVGSPSLGYSHQRSMGAEHQGQARAIATPVLRNFERDAGRLSLLRSHSRFEMVYLLGRAWVPHLLPQQVRSGD